MDDFKPYTMFSLWRIYLLKPTIFQWGYNGDTMGFITHDKWHKDEIIMFYLWYIIKGSWEAIFRVTDVG